ncbi:hypothetical protein Q8A67_015529 [Cirrhinus molitorella]|uniref:Uncharacterized protein n=1 Tax=Cirrhinus molitorella TaxID=172907 RepID=A0AA88TLT5_9TELE|nr:hypothetical protein Q8A67_015529 [Cirrhinus molitorella]
MVPFTNQRYASLYKRSRHILIFLLQPVLSENGGVCRITTWFHRSHYFRGRMMHNELTMNERSCHQRGVVLPVRKRPVVCRSVHWCQGPAGLVEQMQVFSSS